jgi:hypothetical protein
MKTQTIQYEILVGIVQTFANMLLANLRQQLLLLGAGKNSEMEDIMI